MTRPLRLYAATPEGPIALPSPEGVTQLNDAFDAYPLGIYEGLRTLDGNRLVGLPEHLQRATRSLERLGWNIQLDRRSLCRSLGTVLQDAREDSRVRFDVLRESIPAGSGRSRLLFGTAPLTLPAPDAYKRGVEVSILRELSRQDPLIKNASFVLERRGFADAAKDVHEQLLVDARERVLECTSSSFFGIRRNSLVTAGSGVLEGVTAAEVLRLARELGIDTNENGLAVSELATLDEAFLTSSVRGVLPIVAIDTLCIGDGEPGPKTRELMDRYAETIQRTARTAIDVGNQL